MASASDVGAASQDPAELTTGDLLLQLWRVRCSNRQPSWAPPTLRHAGCGLSNLQLVLINGGGGEKARNLMELYLHVNGLTFFFPERLFEVEILKLYTIKQVSDYLDQQC